MALEAVLLVAAAAPPATCLAYLGREAIVWRRRLADSERELKRVRRRVSKQTRGLRPAAAL